MNSEAREPLLGGGDGMPTAAGGPQRHLNRREIWGCLSRDGGRGLQTTTSTTLIPDVIKGASMMIEFQQRKCSIIFDLSSKLARVLEFCTCKIPQAFLSRADTNFCRLVELIVFVLNHLASVADPEFFDLTLRRPGQTPEKVN
ncbi:hypothetical protein L2E82_13637 [Cichorium intybus]|uniref:Uncharacterized protein n=1 Tax=Cichorium intybus TaxID=13427 RepID=A0ACB9EX61_CICIN|nr:hypothetical protein L2E82_13637 [Cichorium intybus]